MRRTQMTKSTQIGIFNRRLMVALGLVEDKFTYIDSVQVSFGHLLSASEYRKLCRLNIGAVEPQFIHPMYSYASTLVHQPTPESLTYLSSIRPLHRVNRLDAALDLCFETDKARDEFMEFILPYILMKWHGRRPITKIEQTLYFGGAWRGRNLVMYPDLPSKVSGKPTVHFEARLFSAELCDGYQAGTLDEVVSLDLREIIARNFRMGFINRNNYQKNLDAEAGRQLLAFNRHNREHALDRHDWRRRLKHRIGVELIGESYEPSRDLLAQLLVQRCIDAKSPIFAGAVVPLPFDPIINDATQVWVRRPSYVD